MKFEPIPRTLDAWQIERIEFRPPGGSAVFGFGDQRSRVIADHTFMYKYKPKEGGYYVLTDEGPEYLDEKTFNRHFQPVS